MIITEMYINYYTYNDVIKQTDTIFLEIISDSTINNFKYSDSIDSEEIYAFSFKISQGDESEMYMFKDSLPLINRKKYIIEDKEYEIKKYYYDDPSSIDEESSFFYNEKYGLLVCYNDGWMSLIWSIYLDSVSKQLVDSILSDTTGFYEFNIPEPLPTIE